ERSFADGVFTYDLTVSDDGGVPRERWEGLRLRKVGEIRREGRWPPDLITPYLERRVGELIPDAALSVSVGSYENGKHRQRSDWAISAAMGVEFSPTRRPDGRPDTCAGRHVSTSHAGPTTLAVAGIWPVGCDIEPVAVRPVGGWEGLLRPPMLSLARRLAHESGCGLDEAGTRIWAAMESLTKLGHPAPTTMEHDLSANDAWEVFRAGESTVAVGSLTIDGDPRPTAFAIAVRRPDRRQAARACPSRRAYDYRHVVGFEESNLVGNVYYVNHLRWQGRCREMFLRDHIPTILEDLERDLALVTTSVSCKYLAEIRPFDEIIVRMTLSSLGVDSLDFHFEYLRVIGDDEKPVASGEQSVACMRRDPSGLKPYPIPEVLRAVLERYAR
ncbi:MAG TPA: acyl-CoA thioesterase, partial [Isosphaeraceae bacterium]